MVRFIQPMDFLRMPSFIKGVKDDEPTIKSHHLVLVEKEEE